MEYLTLESRICALEKLGAVLEQGDWAVLKSSIQNQNTWFTADSLELSCRAWSYALSKEKIRKWLSSYPRNSHIPPLLPVQIVMAGNLPLVGLHDLISVFILGFKAVVKLSSKDNLLIPWLFEALKPDFPLIRNHVQFDTNLHSEVCAVLGSGSDQTKSILENQYANLPAIIRGDRHSLAILTGSENEADFESLHRDIRSYYGLGCRNVSLLLIPNPATLDRLTRYFKALPRFEYPKGYHNTLLQQKALLQINGIDYQDAGHLLLVESESLFSPMGVVHYAFYNKQEDLTLFIQRSSDKIQCLVGQPLTSISTVEFGRAQFPELWDYADGLDTLHFLNQLLP